MSRNFVRTGNELRELINNRLNITFIEFSSYCGRPHHIWVSQQVAKERMSFEARARAFLGYLNYRYEETLDKIDGLSEDEANKLKAIVFDQCMRTVDSVLSDQGEAKGGARLKKKK